MSQNKIFLLIIIAVSAVAVADVFLKKTQSLPSIGVAMASPWMWGAIGLYIFQILAFTYLFQNGAGLIYIALLQTILYAVITIFSGAVFFGETVTLLQKCAIGLGIVSVLLMNENFPKWWQSLRNI